MADNIQRSKGRGQGYKFDRGGMPAEMGPFIGTVKNNIDPSRSGRLQVYIEQFGSGDATDESLWRTVSYVPPFYGTTPHNGTGTGTGTFTGNQQSYGFWFTPPDLETQVICFFVAGDATQGYYIGCVPDTGVTHMVPAIGASTKFQLSGGGQDTFFKSAKQLPVTEINIENNTVAENPRFFDQTKPVHSVVAGIMLQQGLINDPVRGPITSNSQRESPSAVFGFSTPGKPIYQGGLNELDIKTQLEKGSLKPTDVQVIGRKGGHSLVMDDGDLQGKDTLIRIRTAKGHQITMSDDGDCFYITHANGQTWLEFGKQGTVDIFSTNSINLRTQGTLNLHADKDINMYAGGDVNIKGKTVKMQSDTTLDLIGTGSATLYSKSVVGIRSDGSLSLKSTSGGWDAGSSMHMKAGCIDLNGGSAPPPVQTPKPLVDFKLANTTFDPTSGWKVDYGTLPTICTRAPTHEPYPYHNEGVKSLTSLTPADVAPPSANAAALSDKVSTIPAKNPIDGAAFLKQNAADLSVGSIDTTQVTGLCAQASNLVNQPIDAITGDKGLGKYGFSPTQLESNGFLKPGTVSQFLSDPSKLTSVLSSPSVWTGRGGVNALSSLLTNEKLQDITQQDIMVQSLTALKSSGVVTGDESAKNLATLILPASKFGADTVTSWVNGTAPANVVTELNTWGKGGQYAIDFVDTKLPAATTSREIPGFTDTVSRDSIDSAVSSVINDPKIPTPTYNNSLYSSLPAEELVYTGKDATVYDRINAERIGRGLAPLTTPRPSATA